MRRGVLCSPWKFDLKMQKSKLLSKCVHSLRVQFIFLFIVFCHAQIGVILHILFLLGLILKSHEPRLVIFSKSYLNLRKYNLKCKHVNYNVHWNTWRHFFSKKLRPNKKYSFCSFSMKLLSYSIECFLLKNVDIVKFIVITY